MSSRPLVGITAYVETATFGVWKGTTTLIPHAYVRKVEKAGGQPIVLPPVGTPADLIDRLDALVLAGGGDIAPSRYDAQCHPRTAAVRAFRDDAELALAETALISGTPLLAICRGMQVVNVLRGGTLHQHLPDLVGNTDHSPAPGIYGRLPVRVAAGSRLASLVQPEVVSHYHHQAVDRLGKGLTASAWSEDGVVEALDIDDHPFALAVQWHPEVGSDDALFDALVAAARR